MKEIKLKDKGEKKREKIVHSGNRNPSISLWFEILEDENELNRNLL